FTLRPATEKIDSGIAQHACRGIGIVQAGLLRLCERAKTALIADYSSVILPIQTALGKLSLPMPRPERGIILRPLRMLLMTDRPTYRDDDRGAHAPDEHRARKRFGQNFLHDQNIIHR